MEGWRGRCPYGHREANEFSRATPTLGGFGHLDYARQVAADIDDRQYRAEAFTSLASALAEADLTDYAQWVAAEIDAFHFRAAALPKIALKLSQTGESVKQLG